MSAERAAAVRLLTRHFVRGLLDNDLLSTHVDRSQSSALLGAIVVSVSIFVTFFLSVPYLLSFIQVPGPTALMALSDRFLFIGASITLSALAALLVWDALALEPRDVAILGPLPIEARTITRAKLCAALVFGLTMVVALNAVPSVLYPLFLTVNLRSMSALDLLRLVVGHATTTIMAGLFGFFGVLTLRGLFRAAFGEQGFTRVSSLVQSALVAGCVTALLLTPTVRASTVRDWVAGVVAPHWAVTPALWYLGVSETVAGDVIADAPIVTPHHIPVVASVTLKDRADRTSYRALHTTFAALARIGVLALVSAGVLAIATFLWNNRRFPDRSNSHQSTSRGRLAVRTIVEQVAGRDPEAQAGFFLALQALGRSAPHRMIVAVSSAGALTLLLVVMISGSTSGRFALQIMMLASLTAGFRYAITVPVELASNWTIRMAWLGDERRYLGGVKRAGVVMLIALPLVLLLPIHVALFGFGRALIHSLCGFLLGVATLDAAFIGYRRLPFACSYLPIENPKVVWPAGIVGALVAAYGFAYVEQIALDTPSGTVTFCAALGGIALITRQVDRALRRERLTIDFEERPPLPTQRLGLFDV